MKRDKSFKFSLAAAAGLMVLAGAPVLRAQASNPYTQIGTIAIPGGDAQIDILWVDTGSDLMYLSNDHSSKGAGTVDVFDVHNDTYLYSMGEGHFVGLYDASHCCNGPTGVLPIATGEVWAGDGKSTINVFDARGELTNTIATGGVARADEMAWDSKDHLLIIGNSSESSNSISSTVGINFLTVINTDTKAIQGKILYPQSTGLEQPVWDPKAERFYVPIDGNESEVDVIDPTKVTSVCTSTGVSCGVTSQIFIPSCPSISGMALIPYERLMLSCGIILSVPGGSVLSSITSPTGAITGDEIYYNAGDGRVYWGTGSPTVVDVSTNQYFANIVGKTAGSHIVAANANNNHIYVPSSACSCIEVFAPSTDVPANYTPFSH